MESLQFRKYHLRRKSGAKGGQSVFVNPLWFCYSALPRLMVGCVILRPLYSGLRLRLGILIINKQMYFFTFRLRSTLYSVRPSGPHAELQYHATVNFGGSQCMTLNQHSELCNHTGTEYINFRVKELSCMHRYRASPEFDHTQGFTPSFTPEFLL